MDTYVYVTLAGSTEDLARAIMDVSVGRDMIEFGRMRPLKKGEAPKDAWGTSLDLDHSAFSLVTLYYENDEHGFNEVVFSLQLGDSAPVNAIKAWAANHPEVGFSLKVYSASSPSSGSTILSNGSNGQGKGHTELIQSIIDGKLDLSLMKDPNERDLNGSWTPLHWAAMVSDQYAMKALIEAGGDPSIRDIRGFQPFHVASHFSWSGMGMHSASIFSDEEHNAIRLQLKEMLLPGVSDESRFRLGELDLLERSQKRDIDTVFDAVFNSYDWARTKKSLDWMDGFLPKMADSLPDGLNTQHRGKYFFETFARSHYQPGVFARLIAHGADFTLLENPYHLFDNALLITINWSEVTPEEDNMLALVNLGIDPVGRMDHLYDEIQHRVMSFVQERKLNASIDEIDGRRRVGNRQRF